MWQHRPGFVLFSFLKCAKIYITCNLPFYPFLSVQFSGIKHIHIVMQPSSPPISRILSSCKTETLGLPWWRSG